MAGMGFGYWRGDLLRRDYCASYACSVVAAMKLVVLESPYAGDIKTNVEYAQKCMHDCLMRGEAPFASHLLYTQPNILDDANGDERKLGMEAGFQWIKYADKTVVYTDLGISSGMEEGIIRARAWKRQVEYRALEGQPEYHILRSCNPVTGKEAGA